MCTAVIIYLIDGFIAVTSVWVISAFPGPTFPGFVDRLWGEAGNARDRFAGGWECDSWDSVVANLDDNNEIGISCVASLF